MADLLRFPPPAAIVFPGENGLGRTGDYDPYDLRLHPDLRDWMRREGYAPLAEVHGYRIWRRRG